MRESILEGLNPEQRVAVTHGEGPLLVLAGAGSGKTRMLTHRIAHLIASGLVRPHEILAVTFTNRAAREMRERVQELLGASARGVWVSTFHATCVRILRREIGHLGYEPSFVIWDDTDSLAAVKRVLRAFQLSDRVFPPRSIRSQIDRFKNRGLLPTDVAAAGTLESERISQIYQRYQTELRRANALDFGDLLLLTVRLFENQPAVLEFYQRRWRHILVDEYQDTNPIQYRLLRLLADGHRNLCVVGDEDQSIYRFREADIRNILDFEKDFPGAEVVRLERNYRSTQAILDAATAVVENNLSRLGKKLLACRAGGEKILFCEGSDERAEAAWVIAQILQARERGLHLDEIAIFYRTHAQSRPFEEELLKYDLPYVVVGGTRFYDRAEVKDALAYLRVVRNPDDTESLLRAINRPARGIGRTTIERLLVLANELDTSLWQACGRAAELSTLGRAAKLKVAGFVEIIEELRSVGDDDGVADSLARALERSGYLRMLERDDSIEAEGRLENLRELLAAAAEFERLNREAPPEAEDDLRTGIDLFLESVTLLSEADRVDPSQQRLPLMTAHVAKGLEFPVVFVVGLEEGLFPHFASLDDPEAIEEERRLCYVAMTRAKDQLHLSHATLRRMYGSVRFNPPSRFLDEIPARLIQGRSAPGQVSQDLPPAAPRRDLPESGPRVDYNEGQWAPDEIPPIEAGTRLEHPVFGAGTVLQLVGSGVTAKIRVRFDRVGQKTIVLRYARLRLLL